MKEAQEYVDKCVNGSFWHDVACGIAKTAWDLSCGNDFVRCSATGR